MVNFLFKYHTSLFTKYKYKSNVILWININLYFLYYNSSSVCLFVCLFVCSLSPPRSFDGSSPNLVGVCRWTSHLPLRGSFSKRSTAQRVNGSLSLSIYYTCTSLMPHSCKGAICLLAQLQSLIRRLLLLHLNGICRWTSQLLLRGSFSKRSPGRRVNGSNGSNGSTAHFHFHYIIYDSRRRQAHATLLQKAHGISWHQAHATLLQKAHSVLCSLDG